MSKKKTDYRDVGIVAAMGGGVGSSVSIGIRRMRVRDGALRSRVLKRCYTLVIISRYQPPLPLYWLFHKTIRTYIRSIFVFFVPSTYGSLYLYSRNELPFFLPPCPHVTCPHGASKRRLGRMMLRVHEVWHQRMRRVVRGRLFEGAVSK